jgi:hypothetical protein
MRTTLAIAAFFLAALLFASGSMPDVVKAVLDFLGLA